MCSTIFNPDDVMVSLILWRVRGVYQEILFRGKIRFSSFVLNSHLLGQNIPTWR